jgi:hypothetical protein
MISKLMVIVLAREVSTSKVCWVSAAMNSLNSDKNNTESNKKPTIDTTRQSVDDNSVPHCGTKSKFGSGLRGGVRGERLPRAPAGALSLMSSAALGKKSSRLSWSARVFPCRLLVDITIRR